MIADAVLLLERVVVLLVDDDERKLRQRNEDAEPRREHDLRFAAGRGIPVGPARAGGKAAVQRHRARTRQAGLHATLELRREIDLGHEDQHLAAVREHAGGSGKVDIGLAAAGDTVQHRRAECACRCGQGIDGRRLRGIQCLRPRRAVVRGERLRLCAAAFAANARRHRRRDECVREAGRHLIVVADKFRERHDLIRQPRNFGHRVDRLQAIGEVGPQLDADNDPDVLAAAESCANDVAAPDFEAVRNPIIEELPRRDRHGDVSDCHRMRRSTFTE